MTEVHDADDDDDAGFDAAPQHAAAPGEAVEALMLAIDAYIAALSPEDLQSLLARTRGTA